MRRSVVDYDCCPGPGARAGRAVCSDPAANDATGRRADAAGRSPPAPAKEPRLAFTGAAGVLLVQVKPDQTATFEELIGKVKDGLAKSENPVRKQQAGGLKVYKAAEPSARNALYVVMIDPPSRPPSTILWSSWPRASGRRTARLRIRRC